MDSASTAEPGSEREAQIDAAIPSMPVDAQQAPQPQEADPPADPSAAPAGSSGASGAAGSAGSAVDASSSAASSEAVLGAACSGSALSCNGPNSRQKLRCDGSNWIEDGWCTGTMFCVVGEGACRPLFYGCTQPDRRICLLGDSAVEDGTGTAAATCSTDRLSILNRTECTGSAPYCSDGACSSGVCRTGRSGNQVENPGFDVDSSGWQAADGTTAEWTATDVTNRATSGAVSVRNVRSEGTQGLYQCVLVKYNNSKEIVAFAYARPSVAGTAGSIFLQLWTGESCDGQMLGSQTLSAMTSGTSWAAIEGTIDYIPDTYTVRIDLLGGSGSEPTSFDQVSVVLQ